MNRVAVLALGIFLAGTSLVAQSDPATEASAAYEAKDWAKSAQLYEVMVKQHPEVARLWFRLATSQQELGQLEQAQQTLEEGLKAGVPAGFCGITVGPVCRAKGGKRKTN